MKLAGQRARLSVLFAATLLAASSTATAAWVDAFVGPPTVPDTTRTHTYAQAGFGFYGTTLGTKQVNQLGFWVSPANPGGVLAIDHDVALYNYNGANYTQIAAATVPAGSTADANGYAWASIPALALTDTRQGLDFYIVTAEVGTDVWAPNTGSANAPTLDPTFGTRTNNGWFSGTAAPGIGGTASFNGPIGNGGYFGPNVGLEAVAPPADLITGVTVQDYSSQLSTPFNRQAAFTVDGSGLTGGTHGTTPDGSMWLTTGTFQAPNDPLPAQITFDLKGIYDLDRFHVWNYNEAGGSFTNRGANDVAISVAGSTGGPFTSLGNFNFAKADGTTAYTGETIDLSAYTAADNARLVRFDITSSHGGDADFAGLSEVQFSGELLAAVTIGDAGSSASSHWFGSTSAFRTPDKAVNGVGLSGATHNNNANDMWLTEVGDPTGYFIVDLKRVHNITDLDIWNYNEPGGFLNRGVQNFDVEISDDGVNFTTVVAGATLARAGGGAEPAQSVLLGGTHQARYVRLNINSNYGDASHSGLSEVRVNGLGGPEVSNPFAALGPEIPATLGGDVAGVDFSSEFGGRPAHAAVDSSGLTASSNGIELQHDDNVANMWMSSGAGTPSNEFIRFDLGSERVLGAMAVWNYNELWLPGRGIRTADIVFLADDGLTELSQLSDVQFLMSGGDAGYDYPQIIDLAGNSGRYVRIDVTDRYPAAGGDINTYVGLSEVKFFEKVPEPSTFALASLGLLGLGFLGWRRKKGARHQIW